MGKQPHRGQDSSSTAAAGSGGARGTMSGVMRASPHLPSVTMVSIDNLFLVVMVCVLIEVYVFDDSSRNTP